MSLITALIVKNSHILAGIYFIFAKNCPRPNLKGFQYPIWTSVNRSGKNVINEDKFQHFFTN